MDIARWKADCPPRFQEICTEIVIEDAWIDWIDIMFEQIGNASGCPPHTHTWYELNYVLSGEMYTTFGQQTVRVRAGEYFLIPPGMIHSHQYVRGNPHEGLCIRWRMKRRMGGSRRSGQRDEAEPELTYFRRLLRLQTFPPGAHIATNGISEQLLSFVEGTAAGVRSAFALQLQLAGLLDMLAAQAAAMQEAAAESSSGSAQVSKERVADPLVRKVEVYLEDFTKDKYSMTELAASLHMSYGHLARLYKERTGMTLVERMNQLRLEKAASLLAQPELMIAEVAERSGYPDIYYFSKAFKRAYGCTPSQYRNK